MFWIMREGTHIDQLGFIPAFMDEGDPRPAAEQIAASYIGGWDSFKGFTYNPQTHELSYPGDPPMLNVASAYLRDELVLVYPYGWTVIVQPDGSFDAARLD